MLKNLATFIGDQGENGFRFGHDTILAEILHGKIFAL